MARRTKAELDAAKNAAATAMDPQTGMDVVHDEKPTTRDLDAARKAELEGQFAEADEKGKAGPTSEQIAEASLNRSIRGY